MSGPLFRSFLFLLVLVSFLTAGCDSVPPSLAPPDLSIAYSDGGTIYLVHGDGSGQKRVIGGGFGQATLSPDGTRIACVNPGDFYITVFKLDAQGELDGKAKTIYNSDAMHAVGGMGKSWSPLWSPDGNRIYFLNQNFLVCYDYQAQRTAVVAQFPEDQYGNELSHCFPKEGNTLYAVTHDMTGMYSIWSLDLVGGQAVSLATIDPDQYQRFQLPDGLPEGVYLTLFGSKENPVSEPVIPPGDRFYFYPRTKKGHFENCRILAGYDKVQRAKFEVTTIETHFHSFEPGKVSYAE